MKLIGILSLLCACALQGQVVSFPPSGGAGGGGGQFSTAAAAYSTGTVYFAPGGGLAANATEANVQGTVTVAGTIKNFSVTLSAAPGSGVSMAFTWRKGGADQAVTCTVSGASAKSCSDTTNSFQTAVNDLVDIKLVVTSGPSASTSVMMLWGLPGQKGDVGAAGPAPSGTGAVVVNTGTAAVISPGAAGHVMRSTGTQYADSAIQVADVPTLNQNTTGTAAGLTGKTFVGTATQVPLLSGTPTGSKCVHTDANGNLTEASADCGSGGSGASAIVQLTDFIPSLGSGTLTVGCASGNCKYNTGVKVYTFTSNATAGTLVGNSATGTTYTYIDSSGVLDFGVDGTVVTGATLSGMTLVTGISNYPPGSKPIAHCAVSGNAFTSCTDDRSLIGREVIEPGSGTPGIIITENTTTGHVGVSVNSTVVGFLGVSNTWSNLQTFTAGLATGGPTDPMGIFGLHGTSTAACPTASIGTGQFCLFYDSGNSDHLSIKNSAGTVTDLMALVGESIVTTVGTPGLDTNIPSEKAVRSAISSSGGGTVTSSGSPAIHMVPVFTTGTDIKGIAVGATDTVFMGTSASDPSWVAVANCANDGTHALVYSTSTHTFACATISAGAGTVNSGTGGQFAYYPSTAAAVSGDANITQNADGSINLGKAITWASAYKPTFNVGGTTTCDFSQGNLCEVDFGAGNTTLAFTNPHGSGPYLLRSCQDSVGARTYTFAGTMKGFSQPDPAAGTTNCTEQALSFDGTNYQGGAATVPTSAWHGQSAPEGTCPSGLSGSDIMCADSTAHRWKMLNNGGAAVQVVASGGDINTSDQVTGVHLTVAAITTSPYSVAAGVSYVSCDATAGAITINLPAATGTGREITVKKIDSSANACTPTRAGSDTIDGATSFSLTVQYASSKVVDAVSASWHRSHVNQLGGDLSGVSTNATVSKVNGNTPGNTCTNQFTRSIDSSGRGTCASVAPTDIAAQAAHTILMNGTTGSAAPTATAVGTGVDTFLVTPTSANLAAALTDETGTGAAVFASAPALVNPTVNTASSLSAGTGSGLFIPGTSLTAGTVYYQASGGLTAAKADSSTTLPAICIAITTTACMYNGVFKFSSSQSWTAGNILYVSAASAGAIVTTAPSTSTNLVQRIGVALAADTALIMLSLDAGTVQ